MARGCLGARAVVRFPLDSGGGANPFRLAFSCKTAGVFPDAGVAAGVDWRRNFLDDELRAVIREHLVF